MNTHNSFKSNYKFFLNFLNFLLSIKVVFSGLFIDIKKLSSFNKYFVVLDTGLYLYNLNDNDCVLIRQFSINKTVNDRIILDSLSDGKNHYILCLVDKLLFIFNENNNISFITVFNNGTSRLTFYYYNISLTENINTTKKIDHDVVAGIKDKMIRCKIIPNKSSIKCFFYKHNN